MMKNFMKAAFVTVLAAFFFISCGSSAGEPQTQQEPETEITNPSEQYYYFHTSVIGGSNSAYRKYEVVKNKNGDIAMYGAYVKGLAEDINNSITDELTRNYLKTYLDIVLQGNYTDKNEKQVLYDNYNTCSYIFEDLIKTLPTEVDAIQLCYSLITVANKGYDQEESMTGKTTIGYNEKMNAMIRYLKYCCMSETDSLQDNYDKYGRDIKSDNCTITAQGLDDILLVAVKNLNQEKGLNITTTQIQDIANILASTRGMQAKIDYKANTYDVVPLIMEENLSNAVDYVYEKSNTSTMEY